MSTIIFGRPFVKRFALCYRSVVCSVCLSVTLVYCGQMAEWIKMPLGTEVRLSPAHTVLDGDPAPPPKKRGHSPPIFGPCLLRPNSWIEQDATWYRTGVGFGPGDIALDGDPASPKKGDSPQFSDHVYRHAQ